MFIERLDLADRSSLDYWLDLLRGELQTPNLYQKGLANHYVIGDGIVAVDTEWAIRQNLTPSAAHPENATQSIYQVDVFHALHCLVRQTYFWRHGRTLILLEQDTSETCFPSITGEMAT